MINNKLSSIISFLFHSENPIYECDQQLFSNINPEKLISFCKNIIQFISEEILNLLNQYFKQIEILNNQEGFKSISNIYYIFIL